MIILSGLENLIFHVENDPLGAPLATGFQLLFGTILPFFIIITSNLIIIITVRDASKKRTIMQKSTKSDAERERSQTQYLTRMLILVSLAYVVTSIPYRLYVVILLIPQIAQMFDLNDVCNFVLYNLIVVCFYGIWIWNYAVNFYMYCAGGGQRYRNDIKEVLTSWGKYVGSGKN
jgi:hypothetical protein